MHDRVCELVRKSLVASLFALGAASTAAQDQSPSNTLHVKSQLVVVDVNVTDSSGNAVLDLNQNDFTLYENAVPQAIRSFEAPSAHTLPKSFTAASDVSLARLQTVAPDTPVTLLVMDELNTQYQDEAFSRTSLKRYLSSQPEVLLQPTALLAVTEMTLNQIQDFTLDRSKLIEGAERHRPVYPFQMMRTGNSSEGAGERFAESLATLQQVAQAMSGFHGRKNIVWIGPGFPSLNMRDLPESQRKRLQGVSERTINMLNDAHVTVYTIDPTMTTSIVADFTQTTDDLVLSEAHNAKNPFDGTISFKTFAPETGGRSLSLGNNIDQEIRQSVTEGSTFYTLSYAPHQNVVNADEEYRRLNIKISRPGLKVVTRQGYFSAPPPPTALPQKTRTKELSFDLGTAAVSKLSYTGVNVLAHADEGGGGFTLQIDTTNMTWKIDDAGVHQSELLLLAVALDKNDKPIGKSATSVTARLPADRELGSVPFATVEARLPVPTNAVRIRFVVRDVSSGRLGSADLVQAHAR